MNTHARQLAFGVVVVSVLALFTAGLAAHLTVVKTLPANESTVAEPPELVQVWFNQAPAARVSRLELRGSSGEVALEKIEVDPKERSISAAVAAPLTPGSYEVAWRSAGDDGHVMRGTFTFAYKAAQ